ncbi:MAG: hypothetical protein F4X83_04460 [Chloroflexi bacterium]|nr:hypothetical protein [Chloroflexota bacterium]
MKTQTTLFGLLGIVASALASTVLLVLAFPPYDYWFLAWVALVPMFAVMALPTPRPRAARAAAALTYVLYMGVLLWQAFPPGLTSRAWRGSDFPPILFLDSPALFVSVILLPTLFVLFYFVRVPCGPPVALAQVRPYFWLLPPAVWTLTEYVRYRLQLGHIWGNLFTTQHTVPAAMVITRLGGPWLLTFCIVLVNVLLAIVLARLLAKRPSPMAGATALATSLIVGGVLLATAAQSPAAQEQNGPQTIEVALVQTGLDMSDYFDRGVEQGARDYYGLAWSDVEELTREQAQGADLIVWPEATVWRDVQADDEARARLAAFAREMDAYLFAPYFVDTDPRGFRNEAVLISPQGEFLGMYAKNYPIIYVGEQSVTGGEHPVFATSLGTFATMMAYDSDFPDVARKLTANGAQLIAVTSHDWVEMSPFQVAASAQRAAENNVTVVKADWRYGSAVILPSGEIIASTSPLEPARTVLRASVPVPAASGSLYTRTGDWFAGLCAVLVVGLLGRLLWARRSADR